MIKQILRLTTSSKKTFLIYIRNFLNFNFQVENIENRATFVLQVIGKSITSQGGLSRFQSPTRSTSKFTV